MEEPRPFVFLGASLLLAAYVLKTHGWRAVLFVNPRAQRHEADAPGDQMKLPLEVEPLARAIRELGFSPLGSRLVCAAFAPDETQWDFVNAPERTFATLSLGRDRGGTPRLDFVSPLSGAGQVITGNYGRPAKEIEGRYLNGGLEEASPERLFRAHQRRIDALDVPAPFSMEARLDLLRAWSAGPARMELRLLHAQGLLWSVGSIVMVAAAVWMAFVGAG